MINLYRSFQWPGPRPCLTLIVGLLILGLAPTSYGQLANGNIGTGAIQIDNPTNADLYPGLGTAQNSGASLDWVSDSNANTDTPTYLNDVAVGIIPGLTGAAKTAAGDVYGHWNGVRIVDGFGKDNDIFLNGGKENDVTTWNVGPGSVGSSKYDFTQGYLANSLTYLYAGFERLGNSGSTAFDLEFNQASPLSSYIPARTQGDVLLTFEAFSSGGGSVVAHYFTWNATTKHYDEHPLPSNVYTAIDGGTSGTPAGPWGHVDIHNGWVFGGNIDQFNFAEAAVPLSLLPGVNSCGGMAFVQIRTRSSATDTSDLKDATRIFPYSFGGPKAVAALTPDCGLVIHYNAAGSKDSQGGTNLTYAWQFKDSGGNVVGTASSASGTFTPGTPGTYTAALTVTAAGGCTDSVTTAPATVYNPLAITGTLTRNCDGSFAYGVSNVSGGDGNYHYQWQFTPTPAVTLNPAASSTLSGGVITVGYGGAASVAVTATVTVTDGEGRGCSATSSPSVTVYPPVMIASAILSADCHGLAIHYDASASGGQSPLSYAWQFKNSTGAVVGTASGASGVFTPTAEGVYTATLTVTDSTTPLPACTTSKDSNPIQVLTDLVPTASKTAADGSGLTVAITGTSHAADSFQWQVLNASSQWVPLAAGAVAGNANSTSVTLSLDDLVSLGTKTALAAQTINGDSYNGTVYAVQVRLHVSRALNGGCSDDSPAVTVKAVKAVDP